ncbi:MAG: UPF0182 family protein, partial [Elusimicrobia bacterium]|nr:UPF0182 family protein [Elusimicrobiota bacterium]
RPAVSRRSPFLMAAGLLVVVLVGGRWLALETSERAWAATFSGGAVLNDVRNLARLLRGLVLLFSIVWATANVFIVYRAIGSVQMPHRLGDLEIVEAVPQRVLFGLTLTTGIVGGIILSWGTGDWWRAALLATAPPRFGVTDPILGRDLGFYIGVLPWRATLQSQAMAMTAGAAAVTALLAGGTWAKLSRNRTEAWEKLAIAQSYAYQGASREAQEQLKPVLEASGKPAAYAQLFAGDLDFKLGRYKEASEAYQKVIERQGPKAVVPIAMADLGLALEASGDCKSSVEANQRFLDAHQDHFMAPQAHASLARCFAALGDAAQAKSTLDRIALLFPDSYWAQWAKERLKS